jgi:hypothetical protein
MSKGRSRSTTIVLEREMFPSKAYRTLSKTSILVLGDFMLKRQMVEVKHKNRVSTWQIKNNGKIIYTYREAKKLGISESSFQRAIDQLIAHGFLSVAQTGAGVERAATLYALDDRWKDYGTAKFKERERPKKARWTGPIGFQKGHRKYGPKQTAEKITTLKNDNTGVAKNGNTATNGNFKNGNTECCAKVGKTAVCTAP